MPYQIYIKFKNDPNYRDKSPKLVQLQNYLKHRRKVLGDVNNLVGVDEYIKDKLSENLSNEQLKILDNIFWL